MNRTNALVAALACLSVAGCVSRATCDEAVHGADKTRAELRQRVHELEANLHQAQDQLTEDELGRASTQKMLDDETIVDARLAGEIDRLGGDSRALRAANGKLSDALEGSLRKLDELQRAQAAAETRAAVYRELALKLQNMVDAGDLAIVLRDGRMELRLSNDVLFDSGQAQLKPAGRRALAEIADALKGIPQRRFQVEGHTDDEPIRRSPYKTNWELSTARALEVVSFLVAHDVSPRALSAAGYGEFDPVESNEMRDGRARNRRTEIVLQPNIDEAIVVPDDLPRAP
jgi:chemotaxis protein MotB